MSKISTTDKFTVTSMVVVGYTTLALSHCSVEECLVAKSGLPFIRSGRLRAVARSTGFSSPVEIEASRCKIDTILCNLEETDSSAALTAASAAAMASSGCRERTIRCLPLLDDAQESMMHFSVASHRTIKMLTQSVQIGDHKYPE